MVYVVSTVSVGLIVGPVAGGDFRDCCFGGTIGLFGGIGGGVRIAFDTGAISGVAIFRAIEPAVAIPLGRII